jgi:hypothetical protein
MDLNPVGEPPSYSARWCPSCQRWFDRSAGFGRIGRRCPLCFTALVRQIRDTYRPRPGELRPGVVAEFADPRDKYDPARALAELRARLTVKAHETLGQ